MVFKPINLARQGLVKTFTHGYAQSLVAASQSSSASQNTFFSFHNNVSGLFGKAGPPTVLQNAFPNQSSSAGSGADAGSGAGAKAGHSHTDISGGDGGLAAYYAAWQKHQKNDDKEKDKEWHQFQFAKRIGWKAPTTIPAPSAKSKPQQLPQAAQPPSRRRALSRTKSASVLEGVRRVEEQESGVVEPAVEETSVPLFAAVPEQEEVSAEVLNLATESIARKASPQVSPSEDSVSLWTGTDATSISDADHYTEHLTHLAETQQYASVPPVFESMLVAGVKPSSSAYNALLLAAINITRGKHQVVPKVLDVYSDMLRRKVVPDTATYAILIELLAARAMDVTAMKKDLTARKARFGGMEARDSFLFRSDQTELDILHEDDSLSLAIRLFDTSAALATKHIFSAETYRLLISACAEQGRIGDMVRIFADMESQSISAPTAIFSPMIEAFAGVGDLKSAVDCYNEYKALAIAHDQGIKTIVRKDEEVYAAVVNAYVTCGRTKDGLKFFGKLQDVLASSSNISAIKDAVALRAILPEMLAEGRHSEALSYASDTLTSSAKVQAVAAICEDAADKDKPLAASKAFSMLTTSQTGLSRASAIAMLAMHIRNADVQTAQAIWTNFLQSESVSSFVEPTTMYALSTIVSNDSEANLSDVRNMFGRIRGSCSDKQNRAEIVERIDESIELMGKQMMLTASSPTAYATLIKMMLENGGLTPVAEALLARLGPEELSQLLSGDLHMIAQIEAEMLNGRVSHDVAHAARFAYTVELLISSNYSLDGLRRSQITDALSKIERLDLVSRLQNSTLISQPAPTQFATYSPVSTVASLTIEDSFDPYGHNTDFKGSAIIAEELEKTHGRFAGHLNEALARFKNMRRAGRHPRYTTYAKLITAAAKESNMSLTNEILANARQDVPLILGNRTVRQGWIAIYDAMVAAALTMNNRELAAQFHRALNDLDSAPSANTFGLYITTLASTNSTLDEATTAVQIFQRAKDEGVQPTSFLYNALIGKLGKARRIDDTLFHFAAMRAAGIRPTSVTYGTVVNALCRVSDAKSAEQLFDEMEAAENYKPRPAPYNSLMQYFLTTAQDRGKVLAYYARMQARGIPPTSHTYKLLLDAQASLAPVDMPAAEAVLREMRAKGIKPEAVHYAALVHAHGCVLHDLPAAQATFTAALNEHNCAPSAPLYQALFESLVANQAISEDTVSPLLARMSAQGVNITAYIANTLISGWSQSAEIEGLKKAKEVYETLGREKREPSTYEAMARAYLKGGEEGSARAVVGEAMRRGYPEAVVGRLGELVGV